MGVNQKALSWFDHWTKIEITKARVFEIECPWFCLLVCLFCIEIASIHVKCLLLEGVLQQDNKGKKPYI